MFGALAPKNYAGGVKFSRGHNILWSTRVADSIGLIPY